MDRKKITAIVIILLLISLPIILAYVFGGKLKFNFPGVNQPSSTTLPKQNPPILLKDILYCPSENRFCTKGGMVTKNGAYLGFGVKLTNIYNLPVKAAFSGKITYSTTTINNPKGAKEKLTTITLENSSIPVSAIYYFVGEGMKAQDLNKDPAGYVKVGTIIGKVKQNIAAYDTSLLFQLFNGDPTKVKQQILQPNSFIVVN